MMLTRTDHDACLGACADPRATPEEREFLAYMASMAAAGEAVSDYEFNRVQTLTGGMLSREGPIQERDMPRIALGYYSATERKYIRIPFESATDFKSAQAEAVHLNSLPNQRAHHAVFVVTKYDAGTDTVVEWEKFFDAIPEGKSINDFSEPPPQ